MKKMTDYDNYEKECMEIRRRNEELLCLFEEDLLAKGLKIKKTIRNHLLNASLYINEYLLERGNPSDGRRSGLSEWLFSRLLHSKMYVVFPGNHSKYGCQH